MKKLRLFLSLLAITASAAAWAAVGDTFTAQTTEGVTLTFKVTSESPKTCQVGNGIDQVNQVYGETLDKVTIPATANGYSVTAIGRYAFRYWSKTTQFVIPNTVKTLDLGAFMECTGISSIDLNQVETIGDYAFGKCTGITLMILPASVKSIGKAAFQDCYSLKQVTTDGSSPSLQSIGQEAFVGCRQLEGVWFNGSPLTKIGQQAFYNCQALTVASFENCPLVYIMSQAFSGCTALKTTNIFNNIFTIQSIEEKTFEGCTSLTKVKLPTAITYLGSGAFKGCTALTEADLSVCGNFTYMPGQLFMGCTNLSTVKLPAAKSLTNIGESAFEGCQALTSIDLCGAGTVCDNAFKGCTNLTTITTDNLMQIGNSAFYSCTKLAPETDGSIKLPNVNKIGNLAFYSCSALKTVDFGTSGNLRTIGSNAFGHCTGLTSITIPEGTTTIGDNAFSELYNLQFSVPASVKTIGNRSFYDCGKNNSTPSVVNAGVTTVGVSAFQGTKLSDYSFIQNITSMGSAAFKNSSIDKLVLGQLTAIPDEAFMGCNSLTEVSLGSVKTIGQSAFKDNTQLTKSTGADDGVLEVPATVTAIGEDAFAGTSITKVKALPDTPPTITSTTFPSAMTTVQVPVISSVDRYKGAEVWKNYTIESLSNGAHGDVLTVTIDGGVTMKFYILSGSKGSGTCQVGCHDNENNVETAIAKETEGDILIPSSVYGYKVTAIGPNAFAGCSKIRTVKVAETVEELKFNCFSSCTQLKYIAFYNEDKEPEDNSNCIASKNFKLFVPSDIYSQAWQKYSNIVEAIPTNVIIDGLTYNILVHLDKKTCSLGYGISAYPAVVDNTVSGAYAIPTNVNAYTVTTIEDFAYRSCNKLTAITIPASITTIGDKAFYYCSKVKSMFVESSTPASIGESVFCTNTENIYVPASSVNAYKSAWSAYAGKIKSATGMEFTVPYDGYCLNYKVTGTSPMTCEVMSISAPTEGTANYENVEVPDEAMGFAVMSAAEGAFEGCTGLQRITLPTAMKAISKYMFQNCEALKSVTLPAQATAIGSFAFSGCKSLEAIELPANVTKLFDGTFSGCESLAAITLPEGLTEMGASVFKGCSKLTTMNVPSKVTAIGNDAFTDCQGLQTLVLPAKLTTIHGTPCCGCDKLQTVVVGNPTPVTLQADAFSHYGTLLVPGGSKKAYEQAAVWSNFSPIIESSGSASNFDLNGDGKVDISDVQLLLNKIHE